MYPWLFFWAPQYHFPWSGAVAQRISPETLFGTIAPGAGDGTVEKDIFENTASYGKQIGVLSDIVLSLTGEVAGKPRSEAAIHAVHQLETTVKDVEATKAKHQRRRIESAVETLRKLHPSELNLIIARLEAATKRTA